LAVGAWRFLGAFLLLIYCSAQMAKKKRSTIIKWGGKNHSRRSAPLTIFKFGVVLAFVLKKKEGARRSKKYSIFNIQYSIFNIQYSIFNIQITL
jgi:hypothetical protein